MDLLEISRLTLVSGSEQRATKKKEETPNIVTVLPEELSLLNAPLTAGIQNICHREQYRLGG